MKIFINYRKDDIEEAVFPIANSLMARYGVSHVFFDRQGIGSGENWKNSIHKGLKECVLFIPIIGVKWLDILEQRSAFEEKDFVLEEIKMAVDKNIPILPVLLNGAKMPPANKLPKEVRIITEYQAAHVSTDHNRLQDDLAILNEKTAKVIRKRNRKKGYTKTIGIFFLGIVLVALSILLIEKYNFFRSIDTVEDTGSNQPLEIIDSQSGKLTIDNSETEMDYFLNREVYYLGRLMRYEQFISLALQSLKDKGLEVKGPNCIKRYDNYLIRYEVDGEYDNGAVWDTNMDFEVNSQTGYFKPASELAKTYNNLLDEDYRLGKENPLNSDTDSGSKSLNLDAELDYFLNREITWQNKLFRYEQFVALFIEKLKESGLNVEGPVCKPRNSNFLIRYNVSGTDNKGKIWDTKIDFEVNSRNEYFKAISTLAQTLNNLLDPEYR